MTTNQFENCINLSNTQQVRNINEGGEKLNYTSYPSRSKLILSHTGVT